MQKPINDWYLRQTKSGLLVFNNTQYAILQQLDTFIRSFAKSNFFTKLFHKQKKTGFYIYGPVGCGKTMLTDTFYHAMPTPRKMRIHFHEFMSNLHQELAHLKAGTEPLDLVAKKLKKTTDIIFLDEMHVSDIATAMILQKFFMHLFAKNIYIVTSSNVAPDGLYQDGLMRERFLPAISLLKEKLTLLALETACDYRLRNIADANLYLIKEKDSNNKLSELFNKINLNHTFQDASEIEIQSRHINYEKLGKDIIWFDFNIICGDMRSQIDYLELSHKFTWFIIGNLHQLDAKDKDMARRFTWLVDILYDEKNKLILSSDIAIEQIYLSGDYAFEFTRTISRLEEMQTKEYLAQAKRISTKNQS